MKIDIAYVGKLAKLKLNENEIDKFEKQMENIIEIIKNNPEINADLNLLDKNNPMELRKDVAHNDFNRDELLGNAPQIQAGCVVVPKIVD